MIYEIMEIIKSHNVGMTETNVRELAEELETYARSKQVEVLEEMFNANKRECDLAIHSDYEIVECSECGFGCINETIQAKIKQLKEGKG